MRKMLALLWATLIYLASAATAEKIVVKTSSSSNTRQLLPPLRIKTTKSSRISLNRSLTLRGGGAFAMTAERTLLATPVHNLAAAAKAIILSTLACILAHIGFKEVVYPAIFGQKWWFQDVDATTREAVVHDTVTSFIMSPLLVWLYFLSVTKLGTQGVLCRWESTCQASRLGLALHCGMSAYDFVYAFPKDPSKGYVYYLHHAAVLAVFMPVLAFERLHFYAAAAALVEATNPLVMIMQQIDLFKLKESYVAGLTRVNWPIIYVFTGASLLVSWIVVRLMLLPFVGCTYFQDSAAYYAGAPELAILTKTLGAASVAAAAFIWALSCVWFVDMLKIGYKEVFGKKANQ